MQRLLTISYPTVSAQAEDLIRSYRQEHDARHRDVVAAHFTLVYGCNQVGDVEYTKHVASIAANSKSISFCCRYAMLGADDEDNTAYVFLVPDEGYAAVSLLHDRLYSGTMEPYLRLELPYVPHITVGASKNRREAKVLCDAWNSQGVCVEGKLDYLTIGTVEAGKFKNISAHKLREA